MATSEDVRFFSWSYEEGELWWRLVFLFVFVLRKPLYEEVAEEDGEATIPFLVLYLYSCLYLYFCTMENDDLCMRMRR